MSTLQFLKELFDKQLITEQQRDQIEAHERTPTMSVYWELRALLYAGIVLFTSGAGMLIYQNINTIGHNVLIGALAVLTVVGFWYVFRHGAAFSNAEVPAAKLTDFVLLFSCLLFLALEGYVQYQYNVFGTRYGLATALPAVLFLALAYRFDHRGVLSMGLTALASWVGLSVAPLQIFDNNFADKSLIYSAIVLAGAVLLIAFLLHAKGIKKHFTYTHYLLMGNLFLVAALAGLFNIEVLWWLFVLLLVLTCWVLLRYARAEQSFLFLLMGVLYGYVALSYLFFKLIEWSNDWAIFLTYLYFFGTATGVVLFFLNYKKLLGMKNH